MDLKRLKNWFLEHQRDLPWRNNPTPYQVWISEVMLQQTRAETVIPYYLHWIEEFPTVETLASAPLDKVIKLWEGLGYYSRARNLHKGAQEIVTRFGGKIPSSSKDLETIKGLGPYTIGAIRAFAFHQKATAVDGNVIRVLSRHFALEDDISRPKTLSHIRKLAESLLPHEDPWIITEALIELGATICTHRAKCNQCPLQDSCRGDPEKFPVKSKKIRYENLYRAVAVLQYGDQLMVRRAKKGEIMNDLHEFPFVEIDSPIKDLKTWADSLASKLPFDLPVGQPLDPVKHTFTRYRVKLVPFHFYVQEAMEYSPYKWQSIPELKEVAFNSGHRRIFHQILDP